MVTVLKSAGPVNNRTMAMLTELERLCCFPLVIIQGKNNGSESAGTHLGWGVVDIRTRDLSLNQQTVLNRMSRMVGFAAWLRVVAQGFSGPHEHAIAIGDPGMSSAADEQVTDYLTGYDGLAKHGKDYGSRAFVNMTWEKYQATYPKGLSVTDVSSINANIDEFERKELARYQRLEAIHAEDIKMHKEAMLTFKALGDKLDAVIVAVKNK